VSIHWLGHRHGSADSPVHRWPAGLKLGAALLLITGTVATPPEVTTWYAGVASLLLIIIALSRISPLFLLQRLLVLSPFVLGVALVNAWQPAGRDLWLGVALKGAVCLLAVTLLAHTTPFSRILRVLQWLHVPALLITTLALMHRYLFVLAEESGRMRRARQSRTLRPGRRFHWQTLATVAGQLFIRASERAERIYDAMCARGWK
jgi:cobalt/nickel transport system permease protein